MSKITRRTTAADKSIVVPTRVASPLHRSNSSPPKLAQAVANAARVRTFIRFRGVHMGCGQYLRCRKTKQGGGVHISVTNPRMPEAKHFSVDHVFPPSTTQEQVFEAVGVASVDYFLAGYNGSIIAYGPSGSGKTYTMQGDLAAESSNRGITIRLLDYLFANLQDTRFECTCAFVEIHNERIYDLLDGSGVGAKPIRENTSMHDVYVQNLEQKTVATAAQALEWFVAGTKTRKASCVAMNRTSSRSHTVFTLRLTQYVADGVTRSSVLHCVDLAGAEKQNVMDKSVKEVTQINKSLSSLANVIIALGDVSMGIKRHVPYRDCKLTFLLREALGGNSRTTVIATASVEERTLNEAMSTFQFVERVKNVTTLVSKNESLEDDGDLIDITTPISYSTTKPVDTTTPRAIKRVQSMIDTKHHKTIKKKTSQDDTNSTTWSGDTEESSEREFPTNLRLASKLIQRAQGQPGSTGEAATSSLEGELATAPLDSLASSKRATKRLGLPPILTSEETQSEPARIASPRLKEQAKDECSVPPETPEKRSSATIGIQTTLEYEDNESQACGVEMKDIGTTTAGLKRDSWTQADEEEPDCGNCQPENILHVRSPRSEKPVDPRLDVQNQPNGVVNRDVAIGLIVAGMCVGGCSVCLLMYLRQKK